MARRHHVKIAHGTINGCSTSAGGGVIVTGREGEDNHIDDVTIIQPGTNINAVILAATGLGHKLTNSHLIGSASAGYPAVNIQAGARGIWWKIIRLACQALTANRTISRIRTPGLMERSATISQCCGGLICPCFRIRPRTLLLLRLQSIPTPCQAERCEPITHSE